jgi:hypothetical protein
LIGPELIGPRLIGPTWIDADGAGRGWTIASPERIGAPPLPAGFAPSALASEPGSAAVGAVLSAPRAGDAPRRTPGTVPPGTVPTLPYRPALPFTDVLPAPWGAANAASSTFAGGPGHQLSGAAAWPAASPIDPDTASLVSALGAETGSPRQLAQEPAVSPD